MDGRWSFPLGLAAFLAAALSGAAHAGHIVTDGSLGPGRRLYGPDFSISAKLGRQRGGNLFHSFSRFDLDAGESATFSGPLSVTNVLARVTGPNPSAVDGQLSCSIPGANLYLINPRGVVFGPDARLDLQGSFAVTSADVIRFSQGHSFGPPGKADARLAAAPPEAFGFLGPNPGTVRMTESFLQVPEGKGLGVVGGRVRIQSAALVAAGGQINVVSAKSGAEVRLGAGPAGAFGDPTVLGRRGAVQLTTGATLDTSASSSASGGSNILGGGRVVIRTGDLKVEQATVTATTLDDGASRGIDLDATGTMRLIRSTVDTSTVGAGAAGDIAIGAQRLVLVDARILSAAIRPGPSGDLGAPGNIRLKTRTVDAAGQALALDATNDDGAPVGRVELFAAAVTSEGLAGALRVDAAGSGRFVSFGQVMLDSTLSASERLIGPDYAITPDLGRRVGGNLFLSFSAFDLGAGETATFSGPASVRNVLARVTGGEGSILDGTLRCTIPDANFILINPGGVIFNATSSLDVQGSFAVASADSVRLGNRAGRASAGGHF